MLDHGGNLQAACARYGRAYSDWIDLSTGLNPNGYPSPPLEPSAWHRLPEMDGAFLQAAARYYGAESLLAVAGSQAAIQALPALRPPSRVVVAAPSYAEHAYNWSRHGHTLRQVTYDALEASLDECDVMVVCNPNNPTGEFVTRANLLNWSRRLAKRGGWLVVDEAFADVMRDISVVDQCGTQGLIVLRSIGKFFGLAGARVGFVGADEALLRELAHHLGPWAVSGPAQLVTRAALMDLAWQNATAARLAENGERLRELLLASGIRSTGAALFQWWPEAEPEAFHAHMAERGIWVRLFREAARGIRVGLPADEHAWRMLAQALDEWIEKK